ncbi:uncharacterized protein LOC123910093 [Trifolium pratense]|uniref:uncharacterized protein LOC123910093 n=1 Tax=Trifolium pratense TaxID=57577 RepID=UPI001E69371F|nr:uncharacterized protein LOC123910093 [Trifolium pratense]
MTFLWDLAVLTKKERATVVECKGHDAAWFCSIEHAHGCDKEITGMVEQNDGKKRMTVFLECEILKAENAAADYIRQLFMPKLAGMHGGVNTGKMTIFGLDFGAGHETELKI